MFKSKARKAAEFQAKVEKEKQKLAQADQRRAERMAQQSENINKAMQQIGSDINNLFSNGKINDEFTLKDFGLSAAAGLVTGGVVGVIASPLLLRVYSGMGLKQGGKWALWGVSGVFAVPVCWLIVAIIASHGEPHVATVNAPASVVATPEKPVVKSSPAVVGKASPTPDKPHTHATDTAASPAATITPSPEQIEAEREREYKKTYGFKDAAEFKQSCEASITEQSGSNDFGVFNTAFYEYENIGSLVLNISVYGKNAYGTKVEQRWKCWSLKDGTIQSEEINVQFH